MYTPVYIIYVCIYIYIYIYILCIRICVADRFLFVKSNAMRKLGSSPMGCEDFSLSTAGGITNGLLV